MESPFTEYHEEIAQLKKQLKEKQMDKTLPYNKLNETEEKLLTELTEALNSRNIYYDINISRSKTCVSKIVEIGGNHPLYDAP